MIKKLLMIVGTRPEAIKMAPLAHALSAELSFEFKFCVTAQHRDMLDQVLDLYELRPDVDLNIMKPGQDLYDISTGILQNMKSVLRELQPDLVLVHGDTTTTFVSALAAYYEQVPVAHIEAGLRTKNIYSPWPEEANRRLVSAMSKFHFAPTNEAKKNLLREGIPEQSICVTGNTVIDALHWIEGRIRSESGLRESLATKITDAGFPCASARRFILITGHRRENFGGKFLSICQAIKHMAAANPQVDFVYPVHLNPNVRQPVFEILSDLNNVYLIEPQDYASFVYLMMNCYLILTDSGGIQEEAPALGKPVLVMRDTTERPEAIAAGTSKLVGTDSGTIVRAVQELLDDVALHESFATKKNPFGDGKASARIVNFLKVQGVSRKNSNAE